MSNVEGCAKCMKFLLFIVNLVIFLCGVAMFGLGIWSIVSYNTFSQFLDIALVTSAVYLLIIVGGIVAIIAFLGCWGACNENKCLLVVYAIILLLMFVAELVAAGLIFYVGSSNAKEFLINEANKTFVQYGEKEASTISWDAIQSLGECCGIIEPEDYAKYTSYNDGDFPDSCCPLNSTQYVDYDNCYTKGCVTALQDYVNNNMFIAAGVAIGIAFLQLIGIIGGCVLIRSID